jgi:hypothetical protein
MKPKLTFGLLAVLYCTALAPAVAGTSAIIPAFCAGWAGACAMAPTQSEVARVSGTDISAAGNRQGVDHQPAPSPAWTSSCSACKDTANTILTSVWVAKSRAGSGSVAADRGPARPLDHCRGRDKANAPDVSPATCPWSGDDAK